MQSVPEGSEKLHLPRKWYADHSSAGLHVVRVLDRCWVAECCRDSGAPSLVDWLLDILAEFQLPAATHRRLWEEYIEDLAAVALPVPSLAGDVVLSEEEIDAAEAESSKVESESFV